jgi:hypothetical protein
MVGVSLVARGGRSIESGYRLGTAEGAAHRPRAEEIRDGAPFVVG